jgi:hypothetical protein
MCCILTMKLNSSFKCCSQNTFSLLPELDFHICNLLYYSSPSLMLLTANEEELVKVGSCKGVCSRSTIPRPMCLIHSTKCDLQVMYLQTSFVGLFYLYIIV